MTNRNRTAILALAAAGALWGLTVPLSKLALEWLGPGWLTVARFALAAPPCVAWPMAAVGGCCSRALLPACEDGPPPCVA